MNRIFTLVVIALALGAGGWFAWSSFSQPTDKAQHADAKGEPEADHKEGDTHGAEGKEGEHHEEGAGHESDAKVIVLKPEQRKEAGITVDVVQPGPLPKVYRAPGEVRTNDFSTNAVTARHQAVVVERKVKVGDIVTKGQAMLRLFSAEMAEAQTAFVLAVEEQRRVQTLGRDIVAAKRFTEASGKMRETRAKLESFGLASSQIDALAATGRSNLPSGQFDIVAPQAGTVVTEDIRIGAVVEPGKVLFVVTDPGNVWVEAHISPLVAAEIESESGRVHFGDHSYDAKVVQVQQQIDETTRTIGIRLQVANAGGPLKPGLFVDAELYGKSEQVISLPTDAIVRGPDGDWTVYVENEKGQLEPREVKVLYTVGKRTAIEGVAPGTRVVTAGAFFVMAEAAKAGFDPHNH